VRNSVREPQILLTLLKKAKIEEEMMVIDGHCHMGRYPYPFTGEELVKSMDKDSVDKSIIFPFPQAIDNNYIAENVKRFPDRLIGFACINPLQKNAKGELVRSIEVLKLKGLKLHPGLNGYAPSNHELLDPILKLCAEFEIPIIIHGGDDLLTHPFEIEEMVRPFPKVIVVIAHMGFMWLCNQARMVAKRNKNVWLDTAGVLQGEITQSVDEVGADRIVMGTDLPPPGDSAEIALKKIELAVPDETKRNLIIGGNYAKLLKLE